MDMACTVKGLDSSDGPVLSGKRFRDERFPRLTEVFARSRDNPRNEQSAFDSDASFIDSDVGVEIEDLVSLGM